MRSPYFINKRKKTTKYNQTVRTILIFINLFVSALPVYAGMSCGDHEHKSRHDLFFEDFENSPTQWQSLGSMAITTTNVYAGLNSQTFTSTVLGGDARTIIFPVTPGKTYYLHVAYMTLGGGGYIGIDRFDSSQNYIDEQWLIGDGGWPFTFAMFDYNVSNMDQSLLGVWKVYSQAYTTPSDTNFIRIKTEDWGGDGGLPNDPINHGVFFDNIEWSISPKPVPLTKQIGIDIKPGSYPNIINLRSSGVIPVAILSSDNFNAVTEVNPDSLFLVGAKVKMAGRSDKALCHREYVNSDNYLDLVCQFENELQAAIGDSTAVLEGKTFSGVHIRGEDTIRIISTR
jgi:hypothetical protein